MIPATSGQDFRIIRIKGGIIKRHSAAAVTKFEVGRKGRYSENSINNGE